MFFQVALFMSKYIEVIVIVEGKTEEIFIKSVLQPYFLDKNIFFTAIQVSKKGQKGGDVKFSKVLKDITLHVKQRADTFVTLMIDYYGTNEWPGLDEAKSIITPAGKAEIIYKLTIEKIKVELEKYDIDNRFIPYISMHEFETLLFSDSEILSNELNIDVKEIDAILAECGSPEHINNSPQTAPSKRLEILYERFKKTSTGITIADSIGIHKMREMCPLFNKWLNAIEEKL